MDINFYQQKAFKTAIYPSKGYNIYYPALGLAGEVGEICNKIKKIMRDDGGKITEERRKQLLDELGDVLWYAATIATELDEDLNQVAINNLFKLNEREKNNKLHGEGDKR
jgi:NTP pyrophosphatase (non-canonical NTP hydrolase)